MGPIDVGYDPKSGRSQGYPENYGIEAPPPPPPSAQPKAPAPQPVAPTPAAPVVTYSYELSPDEILRVGKNVPNDKLLVAPRYNTYDEMNTQFTQAYQGGYPLPPVAYVGDREIRVAEMEQLKRFVMSPEDIEAYNLGIVNEVAKQALNQIEGN